MKLTEKQKNMLIYIYNMAIVKRHIEKHTEEKEHQHMLMNF